MIDECDRIEYRANRRIVDDDRTTSKMLSKRRTREKEKTIDATDLVRVDYWTIVDVRLTDATNRRHEIKRYQKHCQRKLAARSTFVLPRRLSAILRESERAVVEVVVGRVEARAGLRRAKCGCCNYNV